MTRGEDRALEELLETIDTKPLETGVAELVFHWTKVEEFGQFSRHDLKKEDCS